MALQKPIIQQNGVVTHYHRISNLHLSSQEEKQHIFSVVVDSYLSEESRRADIHDIYASASFIIQAEWYEVDHYGALILIYQKLKELKFFEGATDC